MLLLTYRYVLLTLNIREHVIASFTRRSTTADTDEHRTKPAQPSMYGPLQQFHVQSGSQTAQGHFQLNHYNIVDGVGGASQMPARQMSRSSSSTTLKPTRQPIHQAVQSGSLRGAKLLLDANAKCAHVLDNDGISPAWIAAQGGYADILRLLVTHKVDLNVPNHENNRFPIHQAAQAGHTRIVEMLLQNGADPDPVDNHGITPLWSAAQSGHYEIVKMLLNHSSAGEKVDIETESYDGERRPIHQAAQGGHLTIVQFLLAEGAVCDPMDHHGVTPLWTASQNGHADVVRELLKAGAKVDVTAYEYNRLPIHQAAHGGHIEVVRTLMEFGANPTPEADTFDDSEPSPFLLACACENIELVRLFLEFGVKINTTMKGGKGPLHFASHRGNVKVGQLLIDKGCDVDAREADGWTALILAAQEGHLPFVNLLIDNHANVNAEEKDGATALWVAAQQGHANIVRHLLEAGARQLAAKETGRRPIHQAAQNGHLACVKLLLKDSRGELNRAEQDGFTALTLASQKNQPAHLSVMRYLVSQGAKVL